MLCAAHDGAEIFCSVVNHLAGYFRTRKSPPQIQPYEGILLVVLQHYVVGRRIFFYQRVFQRQRVRFAFGYYITHIGYVRKHSHNLFRFVGGHEKILPHAVAQVFCLAYVQHLSVAVHIDINAAVRRQIAQLVP